MGDAKIELKIDPEKVYCANCHKLSAKLINERCVECAFNIAKKGIQMLKKRRSIIVDKKLIEKVLEEMDYMRAVINLNQHEEYGDMPEYKLIKSKLEELLK